jgi:hypothetical protein
MPLESRASLDWTAGGGCPHISNFLFPHLNLLPHIFWVDSLIGLLELRLDGALEFCIFS